MLLALNNKYSKGRKIYEKKIEKNSLKKLKNYLMIGGKKKKVNKIILNMLEMLAINEPFKDPLFLFYKAVDRLSIPIRFQKLNYKQIKARKRRYGKQKLLLFQPKYIFKNAAKQATQIGLKILIQSAVFNKKTKILTDLKIVKQKNLSLFFCNEILIMERGNFSINISKYRTKNNYNPLTQIFIKKPKLFLEIYTYISYIKNFNKKKNVSKFLFLILFLQQKKTKMFIQKKIQNNETKTTLTKFLKSCLQISEKHFKKTLTKNYRINSASLFYYFKIIKVLNEYSRKLLYR